MSAVWKRWLLTGSVACGLACGDPERGGTSGDSGLSSKDDGGAMDGSARRDASVRDSSTPPTGDGGDDTENCGQLMATIRDFTPTSTTVGGMSIQAHPDFEKFGGSGATKGIVANMLDEDHLPVFAEAKGQITSKASFDQWYRTTPGINVAIPISIPNQSTVDGEYSYDSSAFFPIDGMGFGNYDDGHNFHFTTQIAASFTYYGGEVFDFRGDDDLWIFVNDRLALDVGGLHPAVMDSIDFDAQANALGITKGNTYRMDIFHAERHTNQSNFRIRTTIACFRPPPMPI